MNPLQFALDTSSHATSGIGNFATGGKGNPFDTTATVLGVPWYWWALATAAAFLIHERGGL